jgi:hypothetical protein
VVVLFTHGWLPGLFLFLVSLIVFGLSRMFNLLGGMLASVGQMEERVKPEEPEK